ncbi:hypothetical protein ABPG74_015532 [Tetrahymena malaccensis]
MAVLVKLKQKYIDDEDQKSQQSESSILTEQIPNPHKIHAKQKEIEYNQQLELISDQIEIHLESGQLQQSQIKNQNQNDKFKETLQQPKFMNVVEQDNNIQQSQTQKDIFNGIQRVQSLDQDKSRRTIEQGDIYQSLDLDVDLSQQQLRVDIQGCNKQIKQKYYLKNDILLNKQRRYKPFESIFQTKIETNFFCWSSKNNDTDQLSLSSLLYLNQIKGFLCLFFLLFMLGLPSFYICAKISKDLHYEYINDFQAFLLYPTIAGIGYKFWQCDMLMVNTTLDQTADLKCPYGTLDFQFAQIGLMSADDTLSFYGCEFVELQKIEIECLKNDLSTQLSYKSIYSRCQHKNNCQISQNELLNMFDVSNNCDNNVQNQNIFISVPCRNQNVDIFGIPTSNYQASVAVVLLQTFGIIFCLIFFMHQCYINHRIKNRIKKKITMIQKYSIEIENIPKMHFNWTQELLWLHLQKNLNEYNKEKSQREIKIIDVQMALPECIIKRDLILKKQYENMKNKVIRFINNYDPENSNYCNGIKKIQLDQLRKIFDSVVDLKFKKKCYKDLLDIIEKKSKIEKIKEQINKIESDKYKHSSKAFVTFETKHQRDRALLIMQETLVGQLIKEFLYFFIQYFSKKYQFSKFHLRQNILQIQKTVSPDILIWQNIFVGQFLSAFYLIASLLIPLFLCALGYFIISLGDTFRKIFTMISPILNCYEFRFDNQSVLNKQPQDQNQMQCFCSNNSVSDESCLIIYQMAQLKRLFPYIVMLIVNILSILSVKLVKCFVKKYQVTDKITKEVTLFQILSLFKIGINVGLYYVINKFPTGKSDQVKPVFGNYVDFSPEWYRNVGMFFSIYYLIKIALYLIGNITYLTYRKARLLVDRKCKKKKNITFQKTNFDYINMHQGPEFQIADSYSQIFEFLCVSMSFGFGMPFFYFITFLFLILHLCFEKYYIFRHCRKETYQYNSKISNAFMSFYYYAILTSFLFLAMTYVNKRIFFEIYLQNTDMYRSQLNEQEKINYIPSFTPQNFQSGGSYFMKISTYTYTILFICFYFREKIESFIKYLSYISKYKLQRKVQVNDDSQIQKYPFNYKPLYEFYSIKELQDLSLLQDYYTEKEASDIRKQRFINKKKDIDQVIQNKLEENIDFDYSQKPVSGSLNYDIKLNQKYSRYFDWKTELTILKMNTAKKEEMFSKLTESVAIQRQIQGVLKKQSTRVIIQSYKKQIKGRYQSFRDSKKNESSCTQDNSNQIKFIFKAEEQKQQKKIQVREEREEEEEQQKQNIAKSIKSESIIQNSKDNQSAMLEDQIFSQQQLYSSRIDHHQSIPQFYQVRNIKLNDLNERQIYLNKQI